MSKHSPAPFQRGQKYGNRQDEIDDANGQTVAVVWTRRSTNPHATALEQFREYPEGVANLDLFIAAPALLQQLQEIEEILDDHGPLVIDSGSERHSAIRKALDAAYGK